MKICADIDIPFLKGVTEPFFDTVYLKGSEIRRENLGDAEILLIRTRTLCNAELLEGSRVRFIASATIGLDHIDMEYCRRRGIAVYNAPGCNAMAVVQHVLTALFAVAVRKDFSLFGKKVGIIGTGNVGERLARILEKMNIRVMRCDPPVREQLVAGTLSPARGIMSREGLGEWDYHTWRETVSGCDVVTLHVPLTEETYGLAGDDFFSLMKPGSVFINTCRGEVIDEEALKKYRNTFSGIILDVWSRESDIDRDLLQVASIATPHIAGYSLEGKANATEMIIHSLAEFYGVSELKDFRIDLPVHIPVLPRITTLKEVQSKLNFFFQQEYPIFEMDDKLRKDPSCFEKLRACYNYRRELSYSILKHLSETVCRLN